MTTAVAMPDPEEGSSEFESLWERRMQALSLRNGGLTFSQIATHQRISAAQARRDVEWAKRHIAGEDIEGIIATQRSVIIDMRRANYQAMLTGDKDAAATILKGLDHEAKLLGLYAPVRVQSGPSHIEFSERAAELIKQVSPDTLKELIRGTSVAREHQRSHRADQPPHAGNDAQQPIDVEAVDLPFGRPVESTGRPDVDSERREPDAAAPTAERAAAGHQERAVERADEPDDDEWSNIG